MILLASGAWNHTAALAATFANMWRDPKKAGPFSIADFHPYDGGRRARRGVPLTPDTLHALRATFSASTAPKPPTQEETPP